MLIEILTSQVWSYVTCIHLNSLFATFFLAELASWCADVLSDAKQLIYIQPEASLYEAIKMLIHNKIHRCLYVSSHSVPLRILNQPEASLY